MTPLLAVLALLLLVSGGVGIRAAARVGMGVPLLALAELLAAAGVLAAAFTVELTGAQGLFLVVAGVALVLASSVLVGREVRRRQRIRTASEGARLANYIHYLSRPAAPGEGSPGPGPASSERSK